MLNKCTIFAQVLLCSIIYYLLFFTVLYFNFNSSCKVFICLQDSYKFICSTHLVAVMHIREPKQRSLVENPYWATPFCLLPSQDGICLCLLALYILKVGWQAVCLYEKMLASQKSFLSPPTFMWCWDLSLISTLALPQLYCFTFVFSSFHFQVFSMAFIKTQ